MRVKAGLFTSIFIFLFSTQAFAAELHLYAGAGLRVPTEVIVNKFEKQTGNKVNIEYAGMGQLLMRWKSTQSGDVFLSGSAFYVDEINKIMPISLEHKLVYHTAVPVVRKDKAAGIHNLDDLANSNLSLALGDPQAIALGKSAETMIKSSRYEKELSEKVKVRGTTIKQVLMYILNGDVDAGIIGRSDAVANADKLVMLPTPQGTPQEEIVIATLPTSKENTAAKELTDFFALPENIKEFTDRGYLAIPSNE
ncbi:molybdate ABC transporter substrate-binding protein [Gilliamella sp. wkB178]|uniref:molybdate ABC transporter substrate-binding protein n=1 Tax=Gilliamella sp. wkB178 TaxID=3120259 RepID=UPI00080E9CE2|nr:molybdate ABC transporter substrate-binding protein [Gilliamella apicola]OCG07959.1 molybdate ABC transporter substrate-binding protein [Gilliamella apicola]